MTRIAHPQRRLERGMTGADVRRAEQQLKTLGYATGRVDGVFDRSTFEAVKAFKRDSHAIDNESGALGLRGQRVLARAAGVQSSPGRDKDATVRALTFNWPSRYKSGGEAGDEAMFDRLASKADVMGFPEFGWGHSKVTDNEKNWGFYNPNPRGDGERERVGQVLAWNKKTFNLVKTGTSPLTPKTRVQQQAAGPTLHRAKHVVWAKLRHKETGELWTVAVAHFVPSKHLGGATEKLWKAQRDALASWMKRQGPRTIVMGDFNGEWKDAIARPLRRVAENASAPSHGRRAIDWVLRSKDLEGGRGRALDNHRQSDHRPVVANVRG